jgi:poly(A) polymerase
MKQAVIAEVKDLTAAFSARGYELYLVGGIVRDLWLGAPLESLDFDLTTVARPDEIRVLIEPLADAVWAQGEKFGTIGCRIGDRPYEITTHRAESYVDGSRKPDVVFGDDIEVDLSRRDFTVNAMAIRLSDGELIDPFDGRGALERRMLQTPIEPEVSFSDDPLRILRAARFIARYGLTVSPEVTGAASALIERMSIVSAERIRDEFDKLLLAPEPGSGLAFLSQVGAWSFTAPSIDVGELGVIGEELDRSRVDLDLRRAIVFSHCPSAERAQQLEALRYSNAEARKLRLVLAGVDLVAQGGQDLEDTTVRRLVDRVGYEALPLVLDVIDVRDIRDRGLGGVFVRLDVEEDLSDLLPGLTGDDIMDLLGIEPGPEVGAAMSVLQERRFEDGPLERQDEITFLLEKYRRR